MKNIYGTKLKQDVHAACFLDSAKMLIADSSTEEKTLIPQTPPSITLSGLHGSMPTPSLVATSRTSHSGSLHSRLYLGKGHSGNILSKNGFITNLIKLNLLLLKHRVLDHPRVFGKICCELKLPACHVAASHISHLICANNVIVEM